MKKRPWSCHSFEPSSNKMPQQSQRQETAVALDQPTFDIIFQAGDELEISRVLGSTSIVELQGTKRRKFLDCRHTSCGFACPQVASLSIHSSAPIRQSLVRHSCRTCGCLDCRHSQRLLGSQGPGNGTCPHVAAAVKTYAVPGPTHMLSTLCLIFALAWVTAVASAIMEVQLYVW